MKPTFLDQDSDMVEINLFCEQFTNYLNMGYRGNPPTTGISLHLSPLMHSSWMQALTPKGLTDKNLGQLVSIIQEEGRLRTPVHQRRLQLFKAKRQQTRHTEYIFMLEKLMSVAEFEDLTADEMLIHLFADTAEITMSRIALVIQILEVLSPEESQIETLQIKYQ